MSGVVSCEPIPESHASSSSMNSAESCRVRDAGADDCACCSASFRLHRHGRSRLVSTITSPLAPLKMMPQQISVLKNTSNTRYSLQSY